MRQLLFFLTLILLLFTCWTLWMTSGKNTALKPAEEAPAAAQTQVGGSFTLIDQNGKTVHEQDFRGRVMLVFFGFTRCPDVCPVTAASLSKTMEVLGAQANQVAPMFITVDAENDTPQILKDFLANFDKRLLGLTGTPEQIKQVIQAYKVYAAKVPASESGQEQADTIEHSAFIYIMNKDGGFYKVIDNNSSAQDIVNTVKPLLE